MSSPIRKLMTASLAAMLLIVTQAAPVHAGGNIIDFSLTNANAISLEDNGDWTLAVLVTSGGNPITAPGGATAGEQAITISDLDGVTESSPVTAYLSLLASSAGHRPTSSGGVLSDEFSGNFAITQNADGSGTNYLSGSFTDWTLSGSGSSATMTAGATGTSMLTSDVINDLSSTSVFPFVFDNVTPDLHIQLGDDGGFTVVLADFTAGAAAVPEPSSLVLAGLGALGMAGYAVRRRKASGV